VTALVLAIASFVVCPVLLAVIALALIPGSRRTIRASGGAVEGESLLTAAKIIALINLALFGLVLVGVIVAIIVAAVSSSASSALVQAVSLLS
jgi:hypothetical protein